MDNKKIIVDVLSQFWNANLSSDSTREWIADEIVKKLDNSEYEIRTASDTTRKPGEFEQFLSNIDEIVEEQDKNYQKQIDDKEKEIKENNVVEDKSKKPSKSLNSKKSSKPRKNVSKSFKGIKKPKVNKTKFI
jgi:hypothetical protein